MPDPTMIKRRVSIRRGLLPADSTRKQTALILGDFAPCPSEKQAPRSLLSQGTGRNSGDVLLSHNL